MTAFPSMVSGSFQNIPKLLWRGDVLFALSLVGILTVLILPLNPVLLDMTLAISLAFSVIILMTVLSLDDPLELSVFPTILLVATMLRLALNVASTRLILSQGFQGKAAAGQVIQAFGSFIMGGHVLIGLVVFSILVIINFVVITKGSGRIAEVVARFSLDALPGKQMAVDADLSSGLIDQDEARKKRTHIQDEINFYGAMDGAAKFVRGDAVAGLLITAINLLGGILVGTLSKGISFQKALDTYSFLTVGDGLVSQIPGLIVSVAAGMLISKTSSKGQSGQALIQQLGSYPTALAVSALMMLILAFLPGMPAVPFMFLGILAGLASFRFASSQAKKPAESGDGAALKASENASAASQEKRPQDMLSMDAIKLELGVGLISLIKEEEFIRNRVQKVRESLAQDFGLVVPAVRIVDQLSLETYTYRLKINEIEAAEGRIYPHKMMALDPSGGKLKPLQGEKAKEPVVGLSGVWILPTQEAVAKKQGYVVADGKALMITHMTETLKRFLPDLLTFSLQQKMIDDLPKPYQKLYADMVPLQLSASSVQRVLKSLLAERVSIRDLKTVLEAIGEVLPKTKDPDQITEKIRQIMARHVCAPHVSKDGTLRLVSLSSEWTQRFHASQEKTGAEAPEILTPSEVKSFWDRAAEVYGGDSMKSTSKSLTPPPLLVMSSIRPLVRSTLSQVRSDIAVLGDAELFTGNPVEIIAEV